MLLLTSSLIQMHQPWTRERLLTSCIDKIYFCQEMKHIATVIQVKGDAHESVQQPKWAPDDSLWFVSDATGWWNLYRSSLAEEVCIVGSMVVIYCGVCPASHSALSSTKLEIIGFHVIPAVIWFDQHHLRVKPPSALFLSEIHIDAYF